MTEQIFPRNAVITVTTFYRGSRPMTLPGDTCKGTSSRRWFRAYVGVLVDDCAIGYLNRDGEIRTCDPDSSYDWRDCREAKTRLGLVLQVRKVRRRFKARQRMLRKGRNTDPTVKSYKLNP